MSDLRAFLDAHEDSSPYNREAHRDYEQLLQRRALERIAAALEKLAGRSILSAIESSLDDEDSALGSRILEDMSLRHKDGSDE